MESDQASSTATQQNTVDLPETGSARQLPGGSKRVQIQAARSDSDVHEYVLEDAGEGTRITSSEKAFVGQMAVVRSSTVKKTKRKTLRRTKRSEKRASESAATTPTSKFLREGADVATILAHMRKDLTDAPLQLRCLLALERLVETEESSRDTVAEQNGIELIMEAMNACKSNKDVQGSACWVLSNLCRNKALNGKIVEKGCIDIVMEVFASHDTIEHVQHACLALVCNLALHEETLTKLVAADAIPNVLRAIRDFQENEWIQYTAIQVLQNAANIADLCSKLMEEEIVPVVITAMDSCPDHDELLQSSLWIFSSLAFAGPDESRMKLIEFGVLPVIIKSLKDCGEHRGVYFTGCSAIANIARTEAAVDKIVEANVVPPILDVLDSCLDDPSILQTGCRAIVLLLENNTTHEQCKQHDALKLCKKILELHPDGPVSMEAKQALKLQMQKHKDKPCTII